MHPRTTRRRGFARLLLPPALVLGLGGVVAGCAGGEEGPEQAARTVPSVEAVRAREGTLPLTQRLSGVVRARNQIAIHPEISAVVTEVLVENGSTVEQGDPLVRMRDTEFRERLAQAEANLRIAEAELRRAEALAGEARAEAERMRSLAAKDLASEAELQTAEAQTESAEAGVALAEARVEQARANTQEQRENLARTVIRAPISGTVGDREVEVGMLAGPGVRLFTLGQLDSVRVQVVLTDRMLSFIEEGQRAQVRAGGVDLSAPLARISPFLHPVTHSTEAEIDMANPGGALKPGMFVTVDVHYGESERATVVPLSALHEDPATGNVGLWVTRERFAEEPVDEMGLPQSMSLTDPIAFEFVPAEVVAEGRMEAGVRGVAPGDWVVTLGQNLLGGATSEARVRPVAWERVERLQRLQREDLMQDVIERRSSR